MSVSIHLCLQFLGVGMIPCKNVREQEFMDWLKHLMCNKKTTIIFSACFALGVYKLGIISNIQSKIDIITLVITIVTIIIGFATTALTMFLGVTDKTVIQRIKKRGKVSDLVNAFKDLIYFGGVVIILSMVITMFDFNSLSFVYKDSIPLCIEKGLTFLFLMFTITSLLCAYQLVSLIFLIFKQLLIEN